MLQICMGCTCAFSVGAERCPECGSEDWIDEGTEFPLPPEPIEPPKAKPTKGS